MTIIQSDHASGFSSGVIRAVLKIKHFAL